MARLLISLASIWLLSFVYTHTHTHTHTHGFPDGSAVKDSACKAGDLGSIHGLGRSPGEGNGYPLQYSSLENSMDCIVHGVANSWTWLSNFHFLGCSITSQIHIYINIYMDIYTYIYIYIHIYIHFFPCVPISGNKEEEKKERCFAHVL